MADTDLIERLHIERPAWPDPDGELVRYSDHVSVLARKDARIAELLAADEQRVCDISRLTVERDEARAECEGLRATDYFGELVARARQSATKASAKFPQPNYVTLKIAEEAGEVVRGAVHYAENRMEWDEVEGEIVQLLAMLIRFVTEGDQINGVTPPAPAALSQKETGDAA
jgi:hypothetical protein